MTALKKIKKNYSVFTIQDYLVNLHFKDDDLSITADALIKGTKSGRPSKRLTFNQAGLKITDANIIYTNKKIVTKYSLNRIVHHHSFEEIRFHSAAAMYNGEYTVKVKYSKTCQKEQFNNLKIAAKNKDINQLATILLGATDTDTTSYTINIV